MTQNRSNTYHSVTVWDAVRRDYEGGLTAEQAAERHGVRVRTLHHRAAQEGWRKCDPLRPPALADPEAPGQASLSRQTFDAVARNDRILEVIADSEGERLDLIVSPDIRNMRQFAFRRAAESAALGRVGEAASWMRLIVLMDRTATDIDRDVAPFGHADLLRADHARTAGDLTRLFRTLVPDADDEAKPDEPAPDESASKEEPPQPMT